ncbi:type II secretion system F family protein [Patescibacteria group bacterium]
MKQFDYKAKNDQGKTVSGVVEAINQDQAAKLLRARNLLIIFIRTRRQALMPQIKFFQRVKMDDRVNFTRQLATMVTSGLTITEALSILESQARPSMTKVIASVLTEVEGGASLADAMGKNPGAFNKVYVALVKAGESAGILDNVLERLAENLEKQRNFSKKVKGAMIYPAIIVIGMFFVGLIMMIFVIPNLMDLYEEFQVELPVSTKILMAFSGLLTRYWWVVLVLIAGAILPIRRLIVIPAFRKKFDEVYFRLPVFGKLRKQVMFTEFTRTLGLLIGAGVLMVDALEIVKNSLGSTLYEEAIEKATEKVKKGFPLAVAMAQTEIFPPLLPQMVAVGEETGKVDEVLGKVSMYFEQESEILVKGLTTAIEPLIMVLMGIGVAFLVISVIMPIYNLTSQF